MKFTEPIDETGQTLIYRGPRFEPEVPSRGFDVSKIFFHVAWLHVFEDLHRLLAAPVTMTLILDLYPPIEFGD